MSALLDAPLEAASVRNPSAHLRTTMAAVRVSFTWFGVRKSLTPAQKALAAESFGAEGEYLSAGKKLIDTKHPAFRAVTAIRGRVQSVWKGMTLPFPEPGIRLLRRDQIERFDSLMTDLRAELADEVANLDAHFAELKATACNRLGRLFNPDDYPDSLLGLFGVEWEFPAVEPPSYLQQLSPELYEQERQRIAGRFDEAQAAVAPVNDVAAIFADPHFQARENITSVVDPELGGPVRMQNVAGKLSDTPGAVRWAATRVGEHNREILCDLLGVPADDLAALEAEGVIGTRPPV